MAALNQENFFNPFAFFGLPEFFTIDEAALRQRYFCVCQDQREAPSTLAQAHAAYRILMDPVQRLDVLIAKKALGPLPDSDLPEDIMDLYAKIESLSFDSTTGLLGRLEEMRQQIFAAIPGALSKRDVSALANLRARLMFVNRLTSAIYAKVYA